MILVVGELKLEKINILALKQSLIPAVKDFFRDIKLCMKYIVIDLAPYFLGLFLFLFGIYSVYDIFINGSYFLLIIAISIVIVFAFSLYVHEQYEKSLRKIKRESKGLK